MIPFHVIEQFYEVCLEISKLEDKVKEVDGKWVTRQPHQADHTLVKDQFYDHVSRQY